MQFNGQTLTANIVTMAVFGAIVMYIVSMAALLRLHRTEPGMHRPYRAPLYPFFPVLALALGVVCLIAMVWFNTVLAAVFLALMALAWVYYAATASRRAEAAPDALLDASTR